MKVSVVIPTLNEAKNIKSCLQSLNNQTHKPDEVIVVDASSTDGTPEIAKKLGAQILQMPAPLIHWGNVGESRQVGSERAQGDIIVSTDADTVHPRDWIERILKKFERNSRLVIVGGGFWAREKNILNCMATGLWCFHRSYLAQLGLPMFLGSNMAFRKDTFLKSGGYSWQGVGFSGPFEEWAISRNLTAMGEWEWDDDLLVEVVLPPRLQAVFLGQVSGTGIGLIAGGSLLHRALSK